MSDDITTPESMRPLRFFLAPAFLICGIAIGSLNAQRVHLDLGIGSVTLPLGVAMLAALSAGVLIGGLALTASVVLPMRRRMQQERKRASATTAMPSPGE